jgi:predicted transcriptional regulator of viral defense system
VICLFSAASFYELTTYDPAEHYVAVPHNTDKFYLAYPPIKVFYFSDKFYKTGLKEIETKSGRIKIYDIEKTIIDLFRYKSKLGEDVALESLKNYIKNKKNKINPMIKMAIELGVYKRMEPFIKGAI